MNKDSTKVAPESTADGAAASSSPFSSSTPSRPSLPDDLRLSRLQVSAYSFDQTSLEDDDDDHVGHDVYRNDNNASSPLSRFSNSQKVLFDNQFKRGESETIKKVLAETEVIALKRKSEGFNEVNFTLGVTNCFLISYVMGAYPQHLWLLYFVESFYMIPRKFYNMWRAKPLNQALYYLDFCWCMNFLGLCMLAIVTFCDAMGLAVEGESRKVAFNAFVGVSCGVLLSANIALPFVAVVFHDVNTMTGLFIHLMPPMVIYSFLWHTDEIKTNWPTVFNFSYVDEITYFGGMDSVAGCASILYSMWWVFYTSFMLLIGINLPKRYKANGQEAYPKFDTVFHSTMRQGVCIPIGKFFRGRDRASSLQLMENNDFDLIDFFIYMGFHLLASVGAMCTVGYGCFSNQYVHGAMLAGSVVLTVVRGAKRYTYYSTKMYTRMLRKQFDHALAEDGGKVGYSRMT